MPTDNIFYGSLKSSDTDIVLPLFKVLLDMGPPISKEVQLVSFHTVSKGYWGECGQRGGYFEMTNIPPQVWSTLSNVIPQASSIVNKYFLLFFLSFQTVFLENIIKILGIKRKSKFSRKYQIQFFDHKYKNEIF